MKIDLDEKQKEELAQLMTSRGNLEQALEVNMLKMKLLCEVLLRTNGVTDVGAGINIDVTDFSSVAVRLPEKENDQK